MDLQHTQAQLQQRLQHIQAQTTSQPVSLSAAEQQAQQVLLEAMLLGQQLRRLQQAEQQHCQ